MFDIGAYVVYGSKGVCQIVDIAEMNLGGSDILYYFMEPVQDRGAKVYLPVNNRQVIRSVMTADEARALLEEIPLIGYLEIADERKREVSYKKAMQTCSNKMWVSMIKTLYERKRSRLAAGKKITSLDDKYLRAAEHELFGELSIALSITQEEACQCMEKYIERI